MSHRLADGCQRHILASGNTRPCMSGYIHGERHTEPEPFPEFLEFSVDEMRCAPVLPHGILGRIPDDRKKVGAVIVAIPCLLYTSSDGPERFEIKIFVH